MGWIKIRFSIRKWGGVKNRDCPRVMFVGRWSGEARPPLRGAVARPLSSHEFVPDNCHTRGRFTLYSCRRILYLVSLRKVCRFGFSLQTQRVVNLLQAFFGLVLGNRRLFLKCVVYHLHDFIVVAD